MIALAEEEADARALLPQIDVPREPELMPGCEFVFSAFWQLSDDRGWSVQGFGTPMGATVIEPVPRRIPFSSVDQYARRYGISGEWFDFLVAGIRELDHEYLSFLAEESRERWRQMQQKK